MRTPIIASLAIAAALMGGTQAGKAQSPYSYPWCAVYYDGTGLGGGARSCYYTSWQQCMATLSGIGGYCVESPYYHAQPTQPHHPVVKPRQRRHVE